VLKQATDEGMFNYKGPGQSVLELSHRQDEFREISNSTKAEVKKFLNVPDNYKVLLQ
jgi:phosphoserine aminotransferase